MLCLDSHNRLNRTSSANIVIALIMLVFVLAHLPSLGRANPYSQARDSGTASAPRGTEPPVIIISSPENNAQCNGANISLNFSVRAGAPGSGIDKVTYVATWQEKTTYVNLTALNYTLPLVFSVNFTDVPEGNQSLFVLADETGTFYSDLFHYYHFYVSSVSLVRFTVDNTPPIVSIKSVENKTYFTPDIQLNFTTNEATSQFLYVLDNQQSIPMFGNTTIYDLARGTHIITVHAADVAGNLGVSETINFTVADVNTFPTSTVAAVSLTGVAIADVLLFVFFKRRNSKGRNSSDRAY